MPTWVLGSYSKRGSAALAQEHDEMLAIRPRSRQKSTHDSPDKSLALVRASSWLAQSRGLATIRARHPETGIARLIGVQVYFAVCIAM